MEYKMKKLFKIFILALSFFLIAHCTLLINNCPAQWQPDFRLTNDIGTDKLSRSNARCIVANSSVVHVVWSNQFGFLNLGLNYKRSTDGGVSWGTNRQLTASPIFPVFPSVAVSGSFVHVISNNRDANDEIYYHRSTNAGVNWSSDIRLTNNAAGSWFPSVAASGSVVHVVWMDERDGNWEIYYKRSTDGGFTWETDKRMTNYPDESDVPSIAVSGSVVHLVWIDRRDNFDRQLYYKRSTDGGVSWSADTRLIFSNFDSYDPSVTVYGSVVHVVWSDYPELDNEEIYYKRSIDGGLSWFPEIRLTNYFEDSWFPSVAASGSVVHVVWMDERDGNWEIYYKHSLDGGFSWSSDIRLTNDINDSDHPCVAVSGSAVQVIWEDYRDGNWEIYYKRDPTGSPFGIKNISSDIPKEFSLSQNYPNPFNPSTNIKFNLPKNNYVTLKIYDDLGREIATLVNEQLKAGTYQVDWDGSSYASGVYYYQLVVSSEQLTEMYRETKKMILVK
jgi:hypothetical protein